MVLTLRDAVLSGGMLPPKTEVCSRSQKRRLGCQFLFICVDHGSKANKNLQTPQYNRICKDLCKRGLLDIREQASIIQASYQESEGWEVQIGPNKEAPVEHFDYIVAATYDSFVLLVLFDQAKYVSRGFKLDIERVSALDSIRKSHVSSNTVNVQHQSSSFL